MKIVGISKYIVILHIVYILNLFYLTPRAYSSHIRAELAPGISVVSHPSYKIFIEVNSNNAKNLNQWLSSNLKNPQDASIYKKATSFVVPLNKLKESLYPSIFSKLFMKDQITSDGWVHIVPNGYTLTQYELSLISLAFTGTTENATKIISHPLNKGIKLPLREKNKIVIPLELLLSEIKKEKKQDSNLYPPLVAITPQEQSSLQNSPSQSPQVSLSNQEQLKIIHPELKYGKDSHGEFYSYKIKKGESIYKHVLPKFTNCKSEREKIAVSKNILRRSGLDSEKKLKEGTAIKIPVKYIKPEILKGNLYSQGELSTTKVGSDTTTKSKENLENIVVIIDPGHGGKDHGAPKYFEKIFEDELNYDIAVRLMKYLQENTSAKVYITLRDNSQGFESYSCKAFIHDTDEFILVTPEHNPKDRNSSAHLRWILANSIMRKHEKRGIPREKMIFVSIHFDSLPKNYRGTRIFIPSASYRAQIESPRSKTINFHSFAEWKDNKPRMLSASEKIRDETYSRKFAELLAKKCKNKGIVTYNMGNPIQELINKSPKSTFVPAVLRNTEIPTKVLIESANLNNPLDLSNFSDPDCRQKFAEAIAESIIDYFKD
ncbi:MAG: N-acetylmuramoyl-L-alanine amidase [Candidatus Hydrogenedentes bacterium]|nr:N-acetylmuramoyl-L-alanine amidase [Candidatus Hydrogenedentota bacterium]